MRMLRVKTMKMRNMAITKKLSSEDQAGTEEDQTI